MVDQNGTSTAVVPLLHKSNGLLSLQQLDCARQHRHASTTQRFGVYHALRRPRKLKNVWRCIHDAIFSTVTFEVPAVQSADQRNWLMPAMRAHLDHLAVGMTPLHATDEADDESGKYGTYVPHTFFYWTPSDHLT